MSGRMSERSPGQFARRLLGPQLFKPLGDAYRAFFVDLKAVAASFPQLSRRASILEVDPARTRTKMSPSRLSTSCWTSLRPMKPVAPVTK